MGLMAGAAVAGGKGTVEILLQQFVKYAGVAAETKIPFLLNQQGWIKAFVGLMAHQAVAGFHGRMGNRRRFSALVMAGLAEGCNIAGQQFILALPRDMSQVTGKTIAGDQRLVDAALSLGQISFAPGYHGELVAGETQLASGPGKHSLMVAGVGTVAGKAVSFGHWLVSPGIALGSALTVMTLPAKLVSLFYGGKGGRTVSAFVAVAAAFPGHWLVQGRAQQVNVVC